jgi:hypothetical protein
MREEGEAVLRPYKLGCPILAASSCVKERWRRTSVPEPDDPEANLSSFALFAQTLSSHLVRGIVLIPCRYHPPALLLPAPVPAELYLVHVHDDLPR